MAGFHVVPVCFDGRCTEPHSLFVKRQTVKSEISKEKTLFVVNVPCYCEEVGLRNIFSDCGKISSVKIRDQPGPDEIIQNTKVLNYIKENNYVFKVAYITFAEENSVETALEMSSSVIRYISTESRPVLTGVQKWISEYIERYPCEENLQTNVDAFMRVYDASQQKSADNKPDEEGWVTVPVKRSTTVKTKKVQSKKRFKKQRQERELRNFYMFQKREVKREEIASLRQKFEGDKKRITELRQQRKFKPF